VNTLIGIFELAIGRASGFGRFTVSPRSFRFSLAVLLCVPAVMTLMLMARHGLGAGLTIFLAIVCALLTPAAVTHLLARLWDRDAWWLRFAIGFNYARIALTAVYAILLILAAVLLSAGQPNKAVAGLIQTVMVLYTLWLDWFLLRQGLQVSGVRAAVGVMVINFATGVLVFGPILLAEMMAEGRGGSF